VHWQQYWNFLFNVGLRNALFVISLFGDLRVCVHLSRSLITSGLSRDSRSDLFSSLELEGDLCEEIEILLEGQRVLINFRYRAYPAKLV
jgi:hypothetical protein